MPEEPLRCYRCGHEIPEGAERCAGCGEPVLRVRSTTGISWRRPGEAVAHEAAPPPIQVPAAATRAVYAGFWLRAVAYVVDTVLLGILTAPILFKLLPRGPQLWEQFTKLPPSEFFSMSSPEARSVMSVAFPVVLFTGWLYFALFQSSRWQATPGKRLLGLVVTDVHGRRIGFGRATGRYFAKLISGQLFGLGYILAGFTRRKQALHDFIASTLVVRRR